MSAELPRRIGFWGGAALMVGNILGSGIFQAPGSIAAGFGGDGAGRLEDAAAENIADHEGGATPESDAAGKLGGHTRKISTQRREDTKGREQSGRIRRVAGTAIRMS